jgi:hypothetical protein
VPYPYRHFRPIVTAVVEKHGHLYWIVKGFCNLGVMYLIAVGTSCSEREKNGGKTRTFSVTAESPNAMYQCKLRRKKFFLLRKTVFNLWLGTVACLFIIYVVHCLSS